MSLAAVCWPIERIGDALSALARASGLALEARELPEPGPSILADPDDSAIDRWMAGAAATLSLEAEAIDTDLAGVGELVRQSAPALLRIGAQGRELLLIRRAGRRRVEVIPPSLRRQTIPVDAVRGALCEPIVAPERASVENLVSQTGIPASRRARAIERLLERRLGGRRIGRAWLLRPSPAAPLGSLLRAEGLLVWIVGLVGLRVAELVLTIASWWLIGSLVFEGRVDAGRTIAWLLLLLSVVPCRMGQAVLIGELLRGAGSILKRRLLVGAMALRGDLTRREGAGSLLGRVIETSSVESLGLHGSLQTLFAAVELLFAIPFLATGPAPALHLGGLALWVLVALFVVRRAGLRLRVWTERRAALTDHMVESMVGHRTRLAQESPERWHERDDSLLTDVLAAERELNASETLLVASLSRGWLVLGVAALLPAFIAGAAPPILAAALGGVLLAQRAFATLVAGATRLLGAAVSLRQAAPMLSAIADVDAGAQGLMLALPPVPDGQSLVIARGLGFRYAGRERPVLCDLTVEIDVGDCVLLEGESGGGKSTLGAIIAGLREPTAGHVLLAGLDRATLGLVGWRRRVAAAPQFHENHVFTATFAFNLLMGRSWPPTEAELAEAAAVCDELGLGELLTRMPSGLMQMVGETGWQLSHGERSRLFIARALLQRVDLVVLDESFAALDPDSLRRALRCVLARARTVLVIAHP
ncbi:MAG: ABC transporter ATP-binding protein [Myxococcales bacterium]|nr:ABC transporter ATP-binding protein [Myxococcales bacterium]